MKKKMDHREYGKEIAELKDDHDILVALNDFTVDELMDNNYESTKKS